MAWALWQDVQHRAAKMHVAFEVLRQVPVDVTVTAGNASERGVAASGTARGLLVFDRGYADYTLFQELHDLPSSFVGRVQKYGRVEVQEERSVRAAAQAAGVRRDCWLRRLGTRTTPVCSRSHSAWCWWQPESARRRHAGGAGAGDQSAGPAR